MVTRSYLNSLTDAARFYPPVDWLEIEQSMLDDLIVALPDWDPPRNDTILRRALPFIARFVATRDETQHAQSLRALLAFAHGTDLDVIGLGPPPVRRNLGEDDDSYRLRIVNAHARLNLGSLRGIQEQAFEFNSEITDAFVALAPNRQDVRVFALKGDEQLTADERTALQTFLNADSNIIKGVVLTVAEPILTPVRALATVFYDPATVSPENAEARARAGITAYINGAGIGQTLYRHRLIDAALVEGVLVNADAQFSIQIASTAPATRGQLFWTPQGGDLVPASDFASAARYLLDDSDEGITITLQRVT